MTFPTPGRDFVRVYAIYLPSLCTFPPLPLICEEPSDVKDIPTTLFCFWTRAVIDNRRRFVFFWRPPIINNVAWSAISFSSAELVLLYQPHAKKITKRLRASIRASTAAAAELPATRCVEVRDYARGPRATASTASFIRELPGPSCTWSYY